MESQAHRTGTLMALRPAVHVSRLPFESVYARPGFCSLRIKINKIKHLLHFTAIAVMTLLCACATSAGSAPKPTPAVAQHEGHIYVTGGSLPGSCYQDLGQITLNEPYAQSVVESPDAQAQQLRELARKQYGSNVGAVVNVHDHQNEAGTAVAITGEAVQLQNHETVACAVRDMPAVVDSASAAAAAGIVGTVVGGLSQSGGSVYGAEAGGAFGAAAGAGMEVAKRRQQEQAREAFISDRLQQQQTEIAQLYQQLAKLIGQQCDSEELSEQECEQRITAVEQQLGQTREPPQTFTPNNKPGDSANADETSEFEILNRMQEQQEVIDQLERRIAQIRHSTDNQ
jgi:hypothetical protein